MKEYDINSLDISTASREEWNRFHRYRRKRSSEIFPGDPVDSDSTYEEWSRVSLDDNEGQIFVATMKESPKEIIALLRMNVFKETSASYKGNEHFVRVNSLDVLKEYRRNGIGLDFLKRVYDFAMEKKKRLIIGHTLEEEGRKIGKSLGGTEALQMRVYRLNLEEVDWNMVQTWEREGAEISPDSSLEFYKEIPDDILEVYCNKYTEVYNQMPLDDLDAGALIITPEMRRKYEETYANAGETWLTALIREKNGDISGLSDIVYTPSRAPLLSQELTGVNQRYRGKGKGKWVKAAMLLKIQDEFPDVKIISSTNASSNAPMLSINERLGFKIYREVYFIQVETEKIGEYLKAR